MPVVSGEALSPCWRVALFKLHLCALGCLGFSCQCLCSYSLLYLTLPLPTTFNLPCSIIPFSLGPLPLGSLLICASWGYFRLLPLLCRPPELGGKTLLVKAPHTRVTKHGKIKLVPTWKLRSYWLAFMVMEGAPREEN